MKKKIIPILLCVSATLAQTSAIYAQSADRATQALTNLQSLVMRTDADGAAIRARIFDRRRAEMPAEAESPFSFKGPSLAAQIVRRAIAERATLQGVNIHDREAVYQRIADTSVESQPLICISDDRVNVDGIRNDAAGTCRITGSVNSGSGIGVAVAWSVSGTVSWIDVTRAGITFHYDHLVTTHSEVSGACFAAQYTITMRFTDGTTCTVQTTGNPPHSACTDTAVANSSAIGSAAAYQEFLAPGGIGVAFGINYTTSTANATSLPLPQNLAGVECYVFLNTPLQRRCTLFYASPMQVNILLPEDMAFGNGSAGIATGQIVNVPQDSLRPGYFYSSQYQPGVFTREATGHGVAAGYLVGNYAVLYAEGLNHGGNAAVSVGQQLLPADWVGIPTGFAGLYQVNVPNGASVRGASAGLQVAGKGSQFFTMP